MDFDLWHPDVALAGLHQAMDPDAGGSETSNCSGNESGSDASEWSTDDEENIFLHRELTHLIAQEGFDTCASLGDELCHSCGQLVACFSLQAPAWQHFLGKSQFRDICEIDTAILSTKCPLCVFFRKMTVTVRDSRWSDTDSYCLRASTFSRAFGNSQLEDCPVFCITPLMATQLNNDEMLRFNAYFTQNSFCDWSKKVRAQELQPRADLALCKEWVRFCDHAHAGKVCVPFGGVTVPGFQVIDCAPGKRVLVPGSGAAPFVTLSYVWGPDPAQGPDAMGWLPDSLPDLISGAIDVTLALGYRYLWIDRYCIPQDGGKVQAGLIRNMDQIYAKSALTIVAAAAERPSEGLAGVTTDRRSRQATFKHKGLILTQIMTNIIDEIQDSHWNTRGWTYQESVLSSRRLVFTQSQCYFQCRGLRFLEGLSWLPGGFSHGAATAAPEHISIPRAFTDLEMVGPTEATLEVLSPILEGWIREYSKRHLSNQSDALAAFSGILTWFQRHEGCFAFLGHISGLPMWSPSLFHNVPNFCGMLLAGLSWSLSVDEAAISREDPLGITLSSHDRRMTRSRRLPERRREFPSWTWCGWNFASSSYKADWPWLHTASTRSRKLRHMDLGHEISVGFEQGLNLHGSSWQSPSIIVERAMAVGDARFLQIRGWYTQIDIFDFGGPGAFMPIPIQTYEFDQDDLRWLCTAEELCRHGTGTLRAWALAVEYPEDTPWQGTCLMMMLKDTQPRTTDTYERANVIKARIPIPYNRANGSDVDELARKMGWERKSFRII